MNDRTEHEEAITPPVHVLEERIDMVRKIRRYKDSGKISDAVLDEMIAEVRQYEDDHDLTECEIYNHQSY